MYPSWTTYQQERKRWEKEIGGVNLWFYLKGMPNFFFLYKPSSIINLSNTWLMTLLHKLIFFMRNDSLISVLIYTFYITNVSSVFTWTQLYYGRIRLLTTSLWITFPRSTLSSLSEESSKLSPSSLTSNYCLTLHRHYTLPTLTVPLPECTFLRVYVCPPRNSPKL